jgi:argininosuccinate synthase
MGAKLGVLAYSGGLDTSAIIPWLVDRGYAVHAVLVDVGQNEDLEALWAKAMRLGAETAVIRDAVPEMFAQVIPLAITLGATYEGTYRLGTALARPFIALEQVRRARELGGATLIHGATGKGNDQVRFEFAYRSLAPEWPVLAPWKAWEFGGRCDLIDFLCGRGFEGDYEVVKDFSIDENLWHLSVEGGVLEDPNVEVDVEHVLASVADRFAAGPASDGAAKTVRIDFDHGVPVALDGERVALPAIVARLNGAYRHAPWAWDLVIENRFTGIKSRGLYINPAAKLLHLAVDALARCCLNKPSYDQYVALGRQYGAMLYRGEFFSDQRIMLEAAARSVMPLLGGSVSLRLDASPYVSRIDASGAIFREDLATFEKSDFCHQDAQGFIRLSWLSSIGRPFVESEHADAMETGSGPAPGVRGGQSVSAGGLVPSRG